MTTPRRRCHWRLAAPALAAALALGATGCSGDNGHVVRGINESEADVVVALVDEFPTAWVLPARTWATLFVSFGDPNREIRILDLDCNPIASLPMGRSTSIVHIAASGEVDIADGEFVPPDGVERVPIDHNGGYLLGEADCP